MRPCFCKPDRRCHFCDLAAARPDYAELFGRLEASVIAFNAPLTPEQRAAMEAAPKIDCCGPAGYDSIGQSEGGKP